MKRLFIAMATAVALLASCEKVDIPSAMEEGSENVATAQTKNFTFTCKGDFSATTFNTRASSEYMKADGKELTDMWVYDIMDGKVVQQLHQTPDDDAWGAPQMALKYGTHHIMFFAVRGDDAQVDGTSIRMGKIKDAFFKDYSVSVVSTSNGNRAVTLDRIATALKITIDDATPQGIVSIDAKPATWYDGVDMLTGNLLQASEDKTISISMLSTDAGSTGITLNYSWLAPAEAYDTDVTISAMKSAEAYSTVTLSGNFVANRKSVYHGTLYGASANNSVSLNATWLTNYEGGSWNE